MRSMSLKRRIPKITLFVFRLRCGTLNTNQPKECECIMEFPLSHFNVLMLGLSGSSDNLSSEQEVKTSINK